jgi:hypothetical protein
VGKKIDQMLKKNKGGDMNQTKIPKKRAIKKNNEKDEERI